MPHKSPYLMTVCQCHSEDHNLKQQFQDGGSVEFITSPSSVQQESVGSNIFIIKTIFLYFHHFKLHLFNYLLDQILFYSNPPHTPKVLISFPCVFYKGLFKFLVERERRRILARKEKTDSHKRRQGDTALCEMQQAGHRSKTRK